MKKRPRRPATKSPGKVKRLRPIPGSETGKAAPPPGKTLQYKVVELSTVDEASLEESVNEYVRQGWTLDGVQFAMREASKRPAMAFVFFTRTASSEQDEQDIAPSPEGLARERLVRLASTGRADASQATGSRAAPSAYERLRRLAEDEGDRELRRSEDDA